MIMLNFFGADEKTNEGIFSFPNFNKKTEYR